MKFETRSAGLPEIPASIEPFYTLLNRVEKTIKTPSGVNEGACLIDIECQHIPNQYPDAMAQFYRLPSGEIMRIWQRGGDIRNVDSWNFSVVSEEEMKDEIES